MGMMLGVTEASFDAVPQLVERSGSFRGRAHPLPVGEHFVGRGGQVTVRLDHKDVSRRHARFEVGPDGVWVHDLGSKNGISSEGNRITEPLLLIHGQTISIGDLQLQVSHPASQVRRALAAAGEATVTTTTVSEVQVLQRVPRLWVPLLAVVGFGVLVLFMFLR